MESEELLENVLAKNPGLLLGGLTLVGRQTPTEGGPLDLLGVDEDGRLCVFELKRGTLSREAVAQIIDYASYLDGMELGELATHISDRSGGAHGIEEVEDFEEWYGRHGALESLKPLRLFLVGLGVDDRTERMVRFLAENSGMEVSLLTFHGFVYDGKTFLAKQVEVEAAAEPERRSRRRRVSVEERRIQLERRIEESGVSDLFEAAREMFQENWPTSRPRPGAFGLNIPIVGRREAYARIGVKNEGIEIVFFPAAKALCLDEFRKPLKEIPYVLWPEGREPLEDPRTEIIFRVNAEKWTTHEEALAKLVRTIHQAYIENSINDNGASDLARDALKLFRDNWPDSINVLHRLGVDIAARTGPELTPHARIGLWDEGIGIVFYPASANLCRDKFRPMTEKIRHTTWPHNLEPLTDARAEIQFAFSRDEWETHKEALTELLQTVYAARQESRETVGGA